MTLTTADLASLGLDATRFGQLSYREPNQDYPRSIGQIGKSSISESEETDYKLAGNI